MTWIPNVVCQIQKMTMTHVSSHSCPMLRLKKIILLHVGFNEWNMSCDYIFWPFSISLMSHVDFKKCMPCQPVEFKGKGPYHENVDIDQHSSSPGREFPGETLLQARPHQIQVSGGPEHPTKPPGLPEITQWEPKGLP